MERGKPREGDRLGPEDPGGAIGRGVRPAGSGSADTVRVDPAEDVRADGPATPEAPGPASPNAVSWEEAREARRRTDRRRGHDRADAPDGDRPLPQLPPELETVPDDRHPREGPSPVPEKPGGPLQGEEDPRAGRGRPLQGAARNDRPGPRRTSSSCRNCSREERWPRTRHLPFRDALLAFRGSLRLQVFFAPALHGSAQKTCPFRGGLVLGAPLRAHGCTISRFPGTPLDTRPIETCHKTQTTERTSHERHVRKSCRWRGSNLPRQVRFIGKWRRKTVPRTRTTDYYR